MAGEKLPLGVRLALVFYGLAWRMALPALARNGRLREGWEQRTLKAGPLPKADLWIQAASGGEAYLAWELLRRLPDALPQNCRPRILVTTFTAQGLGVLKQAAELLADRVELLPAWFPFDLPGRMEEALAAVSPRAVVLLETELWPGLMAACRRQGVHALVLNARMTEKSRKGYAHMPGFWKALSPRRVMAVSPDDAARFADLFPDAAVSVMPNIKFDRLDFSAAPKAKDLGRLLPEGETAPAPPFVVLGSVRKQEEPEVLEIVKGLLERVPGVVVGLFPRHMERVRAWEQMLSKAGLPFARRSAGTTAQPGSVILWDAFGELGAAFGLARACFLGGSLADLGGQNFLEPLAHGVVPVIGPSWSNFAWVGAEIFGSGLARREADRQGVLTSLAALATAPPPRAAVLEEAERYAKSRRGGAAAACQAVAEYLICG